MAMTQITTSVETISPAQAKKLLEKNKGNQRSLKASKLKKYSEEMAAGKWKVNGEPLIFDGNGDLVDGQHRLHACIKAGKNFTTLVVRGVQHDAFMTIDTGAARTAGDVFKIAGAAGNEAVLAAALRILYSYESMGNERTFRMLDPTHEQLLQFAQKHPRFAESLTFPCSNKLKKYMAQSTATFLHYVLSKIDPVLTDVFMDALANGGSLGENDPVYHLRERLIENLTAKHKLTKEEVIAYVIKCWNLTRQNQKLSKAKRGQVLRLKTAEGGRESLPRPA